MRRGPKESWPFEGLVGDTGRNGEVEEVVSSESAWSTQVDSGSPSQFTSVSWFLLSWIMADESGLVVSEQEEGEVTD